MWIMVSRRNKGAVRARSAAEVEEKNLQKREQGKNIYSSQRRVSRWTPFPASRGNALAISGSLALALFLWVAMAGISTPLWAQNRVFAYTATGTCSCGGPPPSGPVPGFVSAYTVGRTGALTQIAGSPFPAGLNSHSIVVDPTDKFVYVANHDSNDLSAYVINPTSGALTQIAGSPFPAGTGPHGVTVDPTGKFVYVANEQSNNISAYTINAASGALTPISGSPFPAGAAPHSVTINRTGRLVYVANHDSNNISAYTISRRGAAPGSLTPISGSPFPAGSGPHGVTVDPTDRFVYVANHLSNNISAYTITWMGSVQGALTQISGSPFAAGAGPHGVRVDPTGQFVYVANHDSNNVSAYSITLVGRGRGTLTAVAGSPFPADTGPHGVTVDPSGKFVYVANHLSNDISAYSITAWGSARGALTAISGAPFAGLSPLAVTTTGQ
jgi:6-phosphogluconolactonase